MEKQAQNNKGENWNTDIWYNFLVPYEIQP